MSTSKSFWSSIPVVAKAIGGVLTGLVGVGSLLVALGVVGNSNSSSKGGTVTTTSTVSGPTTTAGAGAGTGVAPSIGGKGSFTVDRTSVTMGLLNNKAVVTVTNKGPGSLSVNLPQITGSDRDRFSVVATECTGSKIAPGKSCSIEVTFTSGGAEASATMVVSADSTSDTAQVKLKGTVL